MLFIVFHMLFLVFCMLFIVFCKKTQILLGSRQGVKRGREFGVDHIKEKGGGSGGEGGPLSFRSYLH